MSKEIYLDSAATAKYKNVDDIIVDTLTSAMREYWQNPSSLYATKVKDKIDECRKNIAKFINASPEEIIFTSGSSESNSMAIKGWVDEFHKNNLVKLPNIITTPIEHKSILNLIEDLDSFVSLCDVNKYGEIDHESLDDKLNICDEETILVSVCMANNEIGTIQDIKKISDLVHKYNGILHIDATQALPYIPIDVEELGVDMMSCSGHKLSPALKGIGFLYKRNGVNISPLICGTQENGLRGGTENVFGIIGLDKAISFCDIGYENTKKMLLKRDYFINSLTSKLGCSINGSMKHRLPNNINVTFPQNITGESLLYTLDMSGVKISIGSACNSHSIEPSHVLMAIGLSDEDAMKTVRFTLSNDITYEDIDYVIEEIKRAIMIIENT